MFVHIICSSFILDINQELTYHELDQPYKLDDQGIIRNLVYMVNTGCGSDRVDLNFSDQKKNIIELTSVLFSSQIRKKTK